MTTERHAPTRSRWGTLAALEWVEVAHDEDDPDNCVWAALDEVEIVQITQGGDLIVLPMQDFGEFVSALERLYAS